MPCPSTPNGNQAKCCVMIQSVNPLIGKINRYVIGFLPQTIFVGIDCICMFAEGIDIAILLFIYSVLHQYWQYHLSKLHFSSSCRNSYFNTPSIARYKVASNSFFLPGSFGIRDRLFFYQSVVTVLINIFLYDFYSGQSIHCDTSL